MLVARHLTLMKGVKTMKKLIMIILCISTISFILAGCNRTKAAEANKNGSLPVADNAKTGTDNPIQVVDTNRLQNIFGFADKTEKYLIAFETTEEIANPEKIDLAIGDNGTILPIKFIKKQSSNENSNERENMYNFKNLDGYIYEVKQGNAMPNNNYYLVSEKDFNAKAIIKTKNIENLEADKNTVSRIEGARKNKVKQSRVIAGSENEKMQICLVVFENRDDILVSLAYVTPEKIIFKDYTEEVDSDSEWVDSENGEINTEMFKVLFVARSTQGILLGITCVGAEIESTDLMLEKGIEFYDLNIGSGRYIAPM